MKAILVIDEMPSECGWECPCYRENNACEGMCTETLKSTPFTDERPSWCPIKPLPKKQSTDEKKSALEYIYEAETLDEFQTRGASYLYGHIDGWNACLEEITE